MEEITFVKKVEFLNPVMIAAWPGMGNVALGAVDYMKKKLKAVLFARILTEPTALLDSVMVEEGIAKFPPPPRYSFFYTKDPELIIFEGEAQVPVPAGIGLLNKVLDLASRTNVRRIYTGAALPFPMSHADSPQVYAAANKKTILEELARYGALSMEGGHISGLNGLILGFAGQRNMEAACLLATMPQYAIGLPNPKASAAIIDVLRRALNFDVDLLGLEGFIREMDEKMSAIEKKMKDVFPADEKAPEAPRREKIPPYIIERIEKMFHEARVDRAKAIILKRELDKWDLYKTYEDRFLDLFKDSQ